MGLTISRVDCCNMLYSTHLLLIHKLLPAMCIVVVVIAGNHAVLSSAGSGIIKIISKIRTCGKPNIQNIMNNVTVRPGQSASFKCQVDMSCIVAYIEWYHEMDNGTEKLIKVSSKGFQIYCRLTFFLKFIMT